jgi:hypothetical protein
MKVGSILIFVLLPFNIANPQSQQGQSGRTAKGSLAVTANVVPSVWLVMEPEGKRDVVVANAPDPKDSFYHGQAKPHRKGVAPAAKKQTRSAAPREQLSNQDHSAVNFIFQMAPEQFEVTTKTVLMDVSENCTTERRPVTVTTIVPR